MKLRWNAVQNKNYKVVISKCAKDMLVHHSAFIAQVSKTAATRLKKEFVISAKSLQQMPQRSPRVSFDDVSYSNYRKLIFEGHYILIYQITDDVVYIDYVVDARQDYQWLLR